MDFNEFFKKFFGNDMRSGSIQPFENAFEDEDDDRQNEYHFHFDMFDIHRQMESMTREMEEMFKNFGAVEFFPAIEQPGTATPQNPRDQMLKDKDQDDSKPIFIQPHKPISPFGGPFTPRVPIIDKKEDSDVDGKLDVDDVAKLFQHPSSQPRFSFKSVTESRVGGPNGTEHRKTIKNADGSSEVIVTRSKGDQTHTVIIKKDKNGVEEKIENFHNMDADDVNKFNKSWNTPQQPSLPEAPLLKDNTGIRDNTDVSLFNKFFGAHNKDSDIGNKDNSESGLFKKMFNWFKPKS